MNAPWNGLPDQPERKGWHIILDNTGDRHEFWWEGPDYQYWTTCEGGDLIWSIEEMAAEYSYAGGVYSSSELVQMRKDERERAAKACDEVSAKSNQKYMKTENEASENYWCGANDGSIMCANAIRALTDDEGKKS